MFPVILNLSQGLKMMKLKVTKILKQVQNDSLYLYILFLSKAARYLAAFRLCSASVAAKLW